MISNAIKYTSEGFVKIYTVADLEERVVKIVVQDSGVGMTYAQQEKLFQAFTKIKENRQLNKEGVGLGLTISRNIAKALGGNITVQSSVGVGSKFILALPLNYEETNSTSTFANADSLSLQFEEEKKDNHH